MKRQRQYLLEELAREYLDEKIYNYLDEHTHLVSSEEYQLTDSEFECYHIDETKYDSRYLEAVGIDFLEVEEEFAMYDV